MTMKYAHPRRSGSVAVGGTLSLVIELLDGTLQPQTGLAYGDVAVYISKAGGAFALKSLAPADLTEQDAAHAPGLYHLALSASDTDTPGQLALTITDGTNYMERVIVEVGTPDAAAISDLHLDLSAASQSLTFVRGLLDENSYDDVLTSDANGNPLTARRRFYTSKANATAHTATGLVATYLGTMTYTNGRLASQLWTLEP